LTILKDPAYEAARRSSRILCFDGWERILTERKNCKTKFSKNITIDHLGQINIELGDYFSFPDNFEKLFKDGDSELKCIFKVSLIPNSFHKLNYTINVVSYTTSRVIEIKRAKKMEEKSI
jgi:hypothetical protein